MLETWKDEVLEEEEGDGRWRKNKEMGGGGRGGVKSTVILFFFFKQNAANL